SISARMVVNVASMKMKKSEIQTIIDRVQIQVNTRGKVLS
ncbi:MAG TPA: ATP phosphoribosyltransferase, partial [Clostridium sp.]|nr:ATP phosphoribosyltransferase [Clostridium sp.]